MQLLFREHAPHNRMDTRECHQHCGTGMDNRRECERGWKGLYRTTLPPHNSMHSLIRKVMAKSMHDMLYKSCAQVIQVSDSADATGSERLTMEPRDLPHRARNASVLSRCSNLQSLYTTGDARQCRKRAPPRENNGTPSFPRWERAGPGPCVGTLSRGEGRGWCTFAYRQRRADRYITKDTSSIPNHD